MRELADYSNRYEFLDLSRVEGILLARLHTGDGPLVWSYRVHQEIIEALVDIGADPSTWVIIVTGTGDSFSDLSDFTDRAGLGEEVPISGWNDHDRLIWEGERLFRYLLDISVPVIAAINGPARVHAEIGLLADIVLASDRTVLGDRAHFQKGIVPGDGVHVLWPLLLGPNRGRYFFLTEQEFTAEEARTLGLVAEVLPDERLLPRAWELARALNAKPRLTLRYTRELLTRNLKKAMLDEITYGMALEGISVAARKAELRKEHRPTEVTE